MKRLEKEQTRTITNTITVFVAEDGTEFSTEEQCRKYEESAMFALKVRIKDKMKLIEDEFCKGLDDLLDIGCRRSDYYYVRLQTEQDVKDFIAYVKIYGVLGIKQQ